jgi:hypothetical protein
MTGLRHVWGELSDEGVEQCRVASTVARPRSREFCGVLGQCPEHPAGRKRLEGGVPSQERLAEAHMQVERAPKAAGVACLLAAQLLVGRSAHQHQIGEPQATSSESGPAALQLVPEPSRRRCADRREGPAVVQLERVAVADGQPGAALELHRLDPSAASDAHPVVGLGSKVAAVGFCAGRHVLGDESGRVRATPRRLSRSARTFDRHDHPRIFT